MKTIADFDLTPASQIYGIANTPLFLIRKLQVDPAVRELSDSIPGEQIVRAIGAAVSREPENPTEAVLPYALLVALWFKPEVEHLEQAATVDAPAFSWFRFIASVLIETFSPIQRQVIQASSQLPAMSVTSSASTSRIILAS